MVVVGLGVVAGGGWERLDGWVENFQVVKSRLL